MTWFDFYFMLVRDQKPIKRPLQWSSKNDERLDLGNVGGNGRRGQIREMCRQWYGLDLEIYWV